MLTKTELWMSMCGEASVLYEICSMLTDVDELSTNTSTMWWMMNRNGQGNARHGNKQQSEQRLHQNGYEMVTEMFEY